MNGLMFGIFNLELIHCFQLFFLNIFFAIASSAHSVVHVYAEISPNMNKHVIYLFAIALHFLGLYEGHIGMGYTMNNDENEII